MKPPMPKQPPMPKVPTAPKQPQPPGEEKLHRAAKVAALRKRASQPPQEPEGH